MGDGDGWEMNGRWMGDGVEGVVASLSLSLSVFDLSRLYGFNHQTYLSNPLSDLCK